jgi:hypothetical protein
MIALIDGTIKLGKTVVQTSDLTILRVECLEQRLFHMGNVQYHIGFISTLLLLFLMILTPKKSSGFCKVIFITVFENFIFAHPYGKHF